MLRIRSFAAAALVACALLTGCSQGSETVRTGGQRSAFHVQIQWPALTRLIPSAAQSIKLVTDEQTAAGHTVVVQKLVTRPPAGQTSSVVDFDATAGPFQLTATAYPNVDGSGTAQAQATQMVTGKAGATTNIDLVMNTTIKSIVVSPTLAGITLGGTDTPLVATAKDAAGATVLTTPTNFHWTVDNAAIASLTPAAGDKVTLHALKVGTVKVGVTEIESSVAAAVTIAVSAVQPTVGPANIVVADVANNRIVGLDTVPATAFTAYNGTQGGGAAFTGNPADIAIDPQGRLYIADYPYKIVRIDDISGKNRVEYDPTKDPVKSGRALGATAIYVDRQGRIYWRDDNFAINRMDDMTGKNHVFFQTSGLGSPSAIAADSLGRIYVTDGLRSRVYRYDDMTGANVQFFGSDGVSAHLSLAYSGKLLDIDAADRIYVADNGNHRIVRLDAAALDDPTKANLVAFALPKDSTNVALSVNSVAVSHTAAPTIYFTASGKGAGDEYVFKMDDMLGTNLVKYGTTGSGQGQFAAPIGLAVK